MNYFAMFLLLVVGCSSNSIRRNQDLSQIKQEVDDEVTIGRHMAAKLLGHFGSYEDAKSLEYVNLVGQSLVKRSGRPEIAFHFGILNSDEANAFATPGGYVFLTKGLLKMLESEAELAGVLAHEMAHVNEKHMYQEISEKREVSAQESISRVLSRGAGDLARSVTKAVDKGMKLLLETGISPEMEKEADLAALFYLSASGYESLEFCRLMKRLSKVGKGSSGASFALRSVALDEALAREGFQKSSVANNSVMSSRFKRSLASLK